MGQLTHMRGLDDFLDPAHFISPIFHSFPSLEKFSFLNAITSLRAAYFSLVRERGLSNRFPDFLNLLKYLQQSKIVYVQLGNFVMEREKSGVTVPFTRSVVM